jgi:hypothetical protein
LGREEDNQSLLKESVSIISIYNRAIPPVPITTNQNVTSAHKIKWFENWGPNTGSDEVIEEVQDEPVTQAQLDRHAKNVMYKI